MIYKTKKKKYFSAVQTIVLGFLLLIFIGTVLLMLPFSTIDGQHTSFIDAFFVATSAICVTGLSPVSTVDHWSVIGQVVIMKLIELDGLGFLSIETLFFVLLRKKIPFVHVCYIEKC